MVMNFENLEKELLITLRGKASQKSVNTKLSVSFNKIYRWESGRDQITWKNFVKLSKIYHAPLESALQQAFSFYSKSLNAGDVIRHFTKGRLQSETAKDVRVSRYTLSRWLNSKTDPPLHKILEILFNGSPDFYRFIELVTKKSDLPSVKTAIQEDMIQMEMFFTYPFLSALLSAIDLATYQKNPSDEFLAKKSRLPLQTVQEVIAELNKKNLISHNGKFWQTTLKRTGLRGSVEGRKKIARYILNQAMNGLSTNFGTPQSRYSWKLFSLNANQYETILQKYTEFFNDIGKIIDQNQDNANKIYLFSMVLADYDDLPVYLENEGPDKSA